MRICHGVPSTCSSFYFYFKVGNILGHLVLFGRTKWQWFYRKYLKCKFEGSNNINDRNLPIFFASKSATCVV